MMQQSKVRADTAIHSSHKALKWPHEKVKLLNYIDLG